MGKESTRKPICHVIAGPNGAGKTTFAFRYLPLLVSCRNFINADEIARGLSPLDVQTSSVQASKLFLSQLEVKLSEKQDFAFETTLSGRSYLNRVPVWRSAGWKIVLIYLFIPNVAFSEERVRQRVMQGGHDIPLGDLERRFPRSIQNLFAYMDVCDEVFCLDNSSSLPKPIFCNHLEKGLDVLNEVQFAEIKECIK